MASNYIHSTSNSWVTFEDIGAAVYGFYSKFKVLPTTVYLSFQDMSSLLNQTPQQILILEDNKNYSKYISTAAGLIKLSLLETADVDIAMGSFPPGYKTILVTNDLIDQEFEKIVLEHK